MVELPSYDQDGVDGNVDETLTGFSGRAPMGPARKGSRALSRNDWRLVANLLSAGLVNR